MVKFKEIIYSALIIACCGAGLGFEGNLLYKHEQTKKQTTRELREVCYEIYQETSGMVERDNNSRLKRILSEEDWCKANFIELSDQISELSQYSSDLVKERTNKVLSIAKESTD